MISGIEQTDTLDRLEGVPPADVVNSRKGKRKWGGEAHSDGAKRGKFLSQETVPTDTSDNDE